MKSRRLLGVALVVALLAPVSATAAGADGPGRNATPSATSPASILTQILQLLSHGPTTVIAPPQSTIPVLVTKPLGHDGGNDNDSRPTPPTTSTTVPGSTTTTVPTVTTTTSPSVTTTTVPSTTTTTPSVTTTTLPVTTTTSPAWSHPHETNEPAPVATVAPVVLRNPQSQSVASGARVAFSAFATGHATVQWQSASAGGSFSAISGATSNFYVVTATAALNGQQYRAVFTNAAGSVTTTAATLSVTSAPTTTVTTTSAPRITANPVSVTTTAGTTATFSAAASGTPAPSVQWQVSTDGVTFSAIAGATSTTYSVTASSALNGNLFRAVFTNSAGSATTSAATLLLAQSNLTTSSNWAGYVATTSGATAISGSWTVPTATCNGTAYAAQWIGLDGYQNSTVEQDGTAVTCAGTSATYQAWYEMYGDASVASGNAVFLSGAQYPVSAGDVMNATVSGAGSSWTLAIADSTKNWHFSITVTGPTSTTGQSAEWIVERPQICTNTSCALPTLAATSATTFTGAQVTISGVTSGLSSLAPTALQMVNGSTPLATPGPVSSTNSFSVV